MSFPHCGGSGLGRAGIVVFLFASSSCRDHTGPSVTAGFSTSVRNGSAPLEVAFTDQSKGDITWWEWDFGDGTRLPGLISSPTHTYEAPGIYTVSLMVMSCSSAIDCRRDWEEKVAWITVTAPVTASAPPGETAPMTREAALGGAASSTLDGPTTLGGRESESALARPVHPSGRLRRFELISRCSHAPTASRCRLAGMSARLRVGRHWLSFLPEAQPHCPVRTQRLFLPAGFDWFGPLGLELLSDEGHELTWSGESNEEPFLDLRPGAASLELREGVEGRVRTLLRLSLDQREGAPRRR